MKENDFKKKLSQQQYHVLRDKGTEMPGTGKFLYNKKQGMYVCGACRAPLFSSKYKFDSGTGWPSFYDIAKHGNVKLQKDFSNGMLRTEVLCSRCGSHLGHVFQEEKTEKCPTGKRFCINSLALDFKENK
ncbi:MAG: peptide-methionine (R)-S-oxide reductase MsrB [Nanoarchaeota archaeon]|nr:peptide-methionine (R)-S-oxide reductase MsrB [Nanoarchaeota archaeon]